MNCQLFVMRPVPDRPTPLAWQGFAPGKTAYMPQRSRRGAPFAGTVAASALLETSMPLPPVLARRRCPRALLWLILLAPCAVAATPHAPQVWTTTADGQCASSGIQAISAPGSRETCAPMAK